MTVTEGSTASTSTVSTTSSGSVATTTSTPSMEPGASILPPPSSESDAADAEFEPTAEMMMDEFDDERTLDEAEAEAAIEGEDQEEEINNLQKEQDMPLEQLLALYGGVGATPAANGGQVGQGVEDDEDDDDDIMEIQEDDDCIVPLPVAVTRDDTASIKPVLATSRSRELQSPAGVSSRSHGGSEGRVSERRGRRRESDLIQLYPELESNGEAGAHRALRSAGQQSDDDDDDDGGGEGGGGEGGESGEEGDTEEYRKTIMIGSAYQAPVPEGMQVYGATPPYENQDKLLWAPHLLSLEEVERYLCTVHRPSPGALPLGLHIRDDEQALNLLLQCDGNVEEARRRHGMNTTPLASTMTLWSEEECRNFENGLKNYGKDFHLIQQNKVRTRSVGELVQFYYLWKKTERHDMFAAKTRLEKKKFIVHPGTTDYMDRFLDEGEAVLANNNNNNNHHHSQTPPPPPPSSSTTTASNGSSITAASYNKSDLDPSIVERHVKTPGSDDDDSSSTSSSAGKVAVAPSSKGKKEYVIPVQAPSETGILNQKAWREAQRPNVAMHALLYGRLPAGYRMASGSTATASKLKQEEAMETDCVRDGHATKSPDIVAQTSSNQLMTSVSLPSSNGSHAAVRACVGKVKQTVSILNSTQSVKSPNGSSKSSPASTKSDVISPYVGQNKSTASEAHETASLPIGKSTLGNVKLSPSINAAKSHASSGNANEKSSNGSPSIMKVNTSSTLASSNTIKLLTNTNKPGIPAQNNIQSSPAPISLLSSAKPSAVRPRTQSSSSNLSPRTKHLRISGPSAIPVSHSSPPGSKGGGCNVLTDSKSPALLNATPRSPLSKGNPAPNKPNFPLLNKCTSSTKKLSACPSVKASSGTKPLARIEVIAQTLSREKSSSVLGSTPKGTSPSGGMGGRGNEMHTNGSGTVAIVPSTAESLQSVL